jgi:hypothetical protein
MSNFTFCAINLEISQEEIQKMIDEVIKCDAEYWYDDAFRNCKLLPLFNGLGTVGAPPPGVQRSKGTMKWTKAGDECPTIKHIMETKVFPFMDNPGRISVLYTPANTAMNVHLDCNRNSIGKLQHKFRIVLKGEIDKLFFLDRNKNKVYVPNHYRFYILDGSHPHAIDPGKEEKITICIGTPWVGNSTKMYDDILSKNLYQFKVSTPEFEEKWECL